MLFKEKNKVVNVRIDAINYSKLIEIADRLDCSLSEVIRKSLKHFICLVERQSSSSVNDKFN